MLFACYVLYCHDDAESFCITYEGIKEMLEVLDSLFNGLIPIELDEIMLSKYAANDLQ
jgi:hypothetical protein